MCGLAVSLSSTVVVLIVVYAPIARVDRCTFSVVDPLLVTVSDRFSVVPTGAVASSWFELVSSVLFAGALRPPRPCEPTPRP